MASKIYAFEANIYLKKRETNFALDSWGSSSRECLAELGNVTESFLKVFSFSEPKSRISATVKIFLYLIMQGT